MENAVIKNAPFPQRLNWAVQGIVSAYRGEHSFRTQMRVAVVTIIVLAILRPGWIWTAVILSLVGFVLTAELFNTALEALIDGLHPAEAGFVRKAKDCAAGAVLLASLAALAGGIAMFLDVFFGK